MGLGSSMRDPRSPAWAVRTACEPRGRPASAAAAAGGWFRSDWTMVAGVRMHARSATGPSGARPAVLLPGIGLSYRYMMPLAAALTVWAPVHVIDQPGGGLSDRPGRRLGLAGLADALLGWIETAGVNAPAVVANSYGCQVAVQAAVQEPARIDRLVLLSPTADPEARNMGRLLRRWMRNSRRERPSQLIINLRDYGEAGPRSVLAALAPMLGDRIEDKLPSVACPALVVRGERDAIVSQGWADEVTALLPRGRQLVVPGGSHSLNYAYADDTARLIGPFLGARR
jgi:2-hydroxy-6-oxonona-2,4-dienedioate hydrolase